MSSYDTYITGIPGKQLNIRFFQHKAEEVPPELRSRHAIHVEVWFRNKRITKFDAELSLLANFADQVDSAVHAMQHNWLEDETHESVQG